MKTLILVTLSLVSIAQAGPISSGGTNQVVESCQTENGSVQLEVAIVNNDHLEASLEDYSDTRSVSITREEVVNTEDGYRGSRMMISLGSHEGSNYATVVVDSEDPQAEPHIYQDMLCQTNVK